MYGVSRSADVAGEIWAVPGERWPDVPMRREVRSALLGHPDAQTRVRGRAPGVFLFITEPIRHSGAEFPQNLPVVGGMFVKQADPLLIEELKRSGVLWKAGKITPL